MSVSEQVTSQIAANRRLGRELVLSTAITVAAPAFVVVLLIVGLAGGASAGSFVIAAAVGAIVAAGCGWAWARWFSARADTAVRRALRAEAASVAEFARLHNLVEGLCVASGVPKPALFVIRAEARNSLAAGLGPNDALVAVTTGLMESLSRIELEGVVAHELSHIRSWDILPATLVASIGSGLQRLPWVRRAVVIATASRRELTADLAGVSLTRYPPGLVAALEKVRAGPPGPASSAPELEHLWLHPTATVLQDEAGAPARSPMGDLGNIELRIEALREL